MKINAEAGRAWPAGALAIDGLTELAVGPSDQNSYGRRLGLRRFG